MSNPMELLAEDRTDKGKGASRRLRREGKVPAILYGGDREPRALSLDHDALIHQLDNEAIYSSILTVTVDDASQPCILKDLHRHPAKNTILHVDLQRILENVEIRVSVPIHFVNEERSKGVKEQGGQISHVMSEIEVSCLPKHLPEYIEVDVVDLALDEAITLSEITLPEGVEIPALAQADAHDPVVVNCHRIRIAELEEEEEAGEEEAAAEPEAEAEDGDEDEEKEGRDEG
jgi:large subunit ribosomal protein L25